MPLITGEKEKPAHLNQQLIPVLQQKKVVMVVSSNRFIKYWLPVIIYAIFIFYCSSIPGENIPNIFTGQDNFFHIIEYAIFALLLSRAIKEYYLRQTRIEHFFWVFILAMAYAFSDEFHQSFVPHRIASLYDVVTDGIGIFIGSVFYRWQR
jgi:hypothetical protein